MLYDFINSLPSTRVRLFLDDKNINYLYLLIGKHLKLTDSEVKNKYTITANFVRQRIFIKGSYEDIFNLFIYLQQFGIQFESITQDELRVDVNNLLLKLK